MSDQDTSAAADEDRLREENERLWCRVDELLDENDELRAYIALLKRQLATARTERDDWRAKAPT